MSINFTTEKYGAYVVSESHERHPRKNFAPPPPLDPAISISYQTGTGTRDIAHALAQKLQTTHFKEGHPWTVLDQQIIEEALCQHRWPKELAQKIPEDKRLFLDELVDDVLGLRPPSWVLVPQVVENILRFAVAGYAVLLGHGVTIVTAKLPNVFHLRLTGSVERRIARTQQSRQLTAADAARFIRDKDRGRERYIQAHFHERLDKEQHYEMVLNTDRFSTADAATLIADAVRRFFAAA